MRRFLYHVKWLPMTGSPQCILQLCCSFFSHTHFWSEILSFLYTCPFFYCNRPLLNFVFAIIIDYPFLLSTLFCPISQWLPLPTLGTTEVWLGAPTIWYYLWILASPRGLQVSWAVAQLGDSTSKFLTYDCSLIWEECFIKPKKMMPGFLKTRNNNHTLRSPWQTLIYKKRASDRSTSLNAPAHLEHIPELCRLFGLKQLGLPHGRIWKVHTIHHWSITSLHVYPWWHEDDVGQVADTGQNMSVDDHELGKAWIAQSKAPFGLCLVLGAPQHVDTNRFVCRNTF